MTVNQLFVAYMTFFVVKLWLFVTGLKNVGSSCAVSATAAVLQYIPLITSALNEESRVGQALLDVSCPEAFCLTYKNFAYSLKY